MVELLIGLVAATMIIWAVILYVAYKKEEERKEEALAIQNQMASFHREYVRDKPVIRSNGDSTDSLTFK